MVQPHEISDLRRQSAGEARPPKVEIGERARKFHIESIGDRSRDHREPKVEICELFALYESTWYSAAHRGDAEIQKVETTEVGILRRYGTRDVGAAEVHLLQAAQLLELLGQRAADGIVIEQ